MRLQSYLNSTIKIIKEYKGEIPLSIYLKKYFALNKRHGSKDRKIISTLIYSFYRLGNASTFDNIEETILKSVYLTQQHFPLSLAIYKLNWENIDIPINKKIDQTKFPINSIFIFKEELSAEINYLSFCKSFLYQPNLFLRARPNKKKYVLERLRIAKIDYTINDNCLTLLNATNLEKIIALDKVAVVQDASSQKVFDYLQNYFNQKNPINIWDCCAASGGKSILIYDILNKNINLTVSDIRLSILLNLHKRFAKANIKNYNYFIADLENENFTLPKIIQKGIVKSEVKNKYQLIICDVPCTGSGTWSRTPENVHFFKVENLIHFSNKQKKIVSNVIPYLQTDGLIVYITCSVFVKENEDIVSYIQQKFNLELIYKKLIIGYNTKADTMFVAILKRK